MSGLQVSALSRINPITAAVRSRIAGQAENVRYVVEKRSRKNGEQNCGSVQNYNLTMNQRTQNVVCGEGVGTASGGVPRMGQNLFRPWEMVVNVHPVGGPRQNPEQAA